MSKSKSMRSFYGWRDSITGDREHFLRHIMELDAQEKIPDTLMAIGYVAGWKAHKRRKKKKRKKNGA